MKNKSILLVLGLGIVIAGLIYAETNNILSNLGSGVFAVGGNTLVTSDHATREFKFEIVTSTVAGAATAGTNTFSETYSAAPNFSQLVRSGTALETDDAIVGTITTTGLTVTGLSTGAVNNVPFLIYGYTRTGTPQ